MLVIYLWYLQYVIVDRFWFLWLEAESFCELDGFTLFLKLIWFCHRCWIVRLRCWMSDKLLFWMGLSASRPFPRPFLRPRKPIPSEGRLINRRFQRVSWIIIHVGNHFFVITGTDTYSMGAFFWTCLSSVFVSFKFLQGRLYNCVRARIWDLRGLGVARPKLYYDICLFSTSDEAWCYLLLLRRSKSDLITRAQIKDPEKVTWNICVATIHFVCHFFRIFNLRPSTLLTIVTLRDGLDTTVPFCFPIQMTVSLPLQASETAVSTCKIVTKLNRWPPPLFPQSDS